MYEKIGWEDSPSTKTPILAVSLNQMDNGIERANKGIVFSYSATFTADGVVKKTSSLTSLGAGDFATSQTDIVTAFIANNVTTIGSGTFANCTSLKTIYIDNTADNISIASGAIPDGINIVYCNDDSFINVNDLLANAIKSLKTKIVADEEQHKADIQALTDKANQLETQATTDRDTFNNQIETINENLDTKESLSNKVNEIVHPSIDSYPSTKGVWDFVETKSEQPLADIEQNKADIATLNANKVNNTDFNSYKTTNDTAVAKKFDSANIESGAGNLYDQQGNIVATFDYTKILNVVTIQLCIQNLSTSLNYVYCYGMPFTISNKNMFRYYVLSNKDIAFENNHAHIKKVNGNFIDGEIVTTSVSYLI